MKIILTGASRGIGYETALELARRGRQVLALSRQTDTLVQAASEWPDKRLRPLAFDLANPDFQLLGPALEELGGVDIVINNAGLLISKPFSELSPADWKASFQVNLFGPAELIRFLLPWLRGRKGAHVVNIGSMGGFQGSSKFPGLAAYSSSKAALANLSEMLAQELQPEGIAVNCLALGAVNTEMLREAFPGYQAPLSSAEMAVFIADFALNAQRFFNGKILPVSVSTP